MDEEINLYYLAGLFDGEGTISIYTSGNTIMLRAAIANTDQELLELIHKQHGGYLYANITNYNYRLYSKIIWQGVKAKEFIAKIADKLIIKKALAELAMNFPVNSLGSRKYFTDDEVELRKLSLQKAKELNRRGSVATVEFIRQ